MIKRNLPLMITIGVFVLGYLYCLTQFPGFASTRVICNILTDNAFLGIIAVGMTFVILSGGIDLSVGSVIAFTGVFLAKVIGDFGLSPLLAFPLVLVMGCAFGAFMGLLIDALKIDPRKGKLINLCEIHIESRFEESEPAFSVASIA